MKRLEIKRTDNGAAALAVSRGFTYAYTIGTFDVYRKVTVEEEAAQVTLEEIEDMPMVPYLACAKIGSKHYAEFNREIGMLTVVTVDGGPLVLTSKLDRDGANDLLEFLFDIRDDLLASSTQ